jgi:hypothetical protein
VPDLLQLVSTEPPWFATAIIGALLGALSREILPRIVNRIWSNVKYDPICGDWFCAHLTYKPDGELFVRHAKWRFTPKRWAGKLQLEVFGENDKIVFAGLVESTEESYRFTANGPQNETASFRLRKVFPDQKETYGVWLGVDFRGKIIASGRLLSRENITENHFTTVMLHCFQQHSRYPVISVSEECDALSDEEPPHARIRPQGKPVSC